MRHRHVGRLAEQQLWAQQRLVEAEAHAAERHARAAEREHDLLASVRMPLLLLLLPLGHHVALAALEQRRGHVELAVLGSVVRRISTSADRH